MRIRDGCATVTDYKLPRPLVRKRAGKAGARLKSEVRISVWLCSSWSPTRDQLLRQEKDEASLPRECAVGPSNAFIPRFAGVWRFFIFRLRAGLSTDNPLRPCAEQLKDQHMKKLLLLALASAGLFLNASAARAAVINEDFTTNPLQNGWTIFGATNLFRWDSTNHQLNATWDSTQPNTFFYYGLDGHLTRYDDFSFQFDLFLNDVASNVEPGKTGPLQIALGFQNYAVATNADYVRGNGVFGDYTDVAEFNYYPYGYYVFEEVVYPSPTTFVPSFVSETPAFSPNSLTPDYVLELPTNVLIHVTMTYHADDQTSSLTATTNGIPIRTVPNLLLNYTNSNFTATDDYNVNMFSITSYTSIGDDFDSLLAHGTIAHLRVVLPPPAQNLSVAFTNSGWQVQFNDKTNWLYTLERTTNLTAWSDASGPVPGNGTSLVVPDTNAPSAKAFYRIRAVRP